MTFSGGKSSFRVTADGSAFLFQDRKGKDCECNLDGQKHSVTLQSCHDTSGKLGGKKKNQPLQCDPEKSAREMASDMIFACAKEPGCFTKKF